MVTYSSLHEWEGESDVYLDCTDKLIPVVMLPYEILAILLKYKNNWDIENFVELWNYDGRFDVPTNKKEEYWSKINNFIQNLIGLSDTEFFDDIDKNRNNIIDCVEKYKMMIIKEIKKNKEEIGNKLDSCKTYEELRMFSEKQIDSLINEENYFYIERIEKDRTY